MTRKPMPSPIAVDSRDHDEQRWIAAGRALRLLEPGEFVQLLALAEAYVSNHEREMEPIETFNARLAAVSVKRGAA